MSRAHTDAVTQIGDCKLEVRLGGVYALGRIGWDSEKDRRTVVDVLGAFIAAPIARTDRAGCATIGRCCGGAAGGWPLVNATGIELDLRNADIAVRGSFRP